MKNSLEISFFVVLMLLIKTSSANADTSVNIQNNTNGATSHVEVNNTSNTSNVESNTNNGHTSVSIETNGQVKTYESDNGQSVHVQSNDGSAKVDINGSGSVNLHVSPYPTLTQEDKLATLEAQKRAERIREMGETKIKQQKSQRNFFDKISDFFINLFFH